MVWNIGINPFRVVVSEDEEEEEEEEDTADS
jgi:hypothetical protein